jgi:hypothetical protein
MEEDQVIKKKYVERILESFTNVSPPDTVLSSDLNNRFCSSIVIVLELRAFARRRALEFGRFGEQIPGATKRA